MSDQIFLEAASDYILQPAHPSPRGAQYDKTMGPDSVGMRPHTEQPHRRV